MCFICTLSIVCVYIYVDRPLHRCLVARRPSENERRTTTYVYANGTFMITQNAFELRFNLQSNGRTCTLFNVCVCVFL